jgi:hypothetical protein
MNLNEEINRIQRMMGILNEVIIPQQFRRFVKKHGFKLECSDCADAYVEHGPDYYNNLRINHGISGFGDEGYSGKWNKYYLIINVSNNCKYGVKGFDRSATSYGRSQSYKGDAIIVADFNYKKDIIDNSEIALCKITYPRDIVDKFYENYKSYIKYKDFDTPDNESYILETNAMPHSVLEEIINFLKTPPKPTVELDKKYKTDNGFDIVKPFGDLT